MDMNIESTLFCSQVVSWAMKNGCKGKKCQSFPELGNNGENIFPLAQSEIVTQNNGFAKMLQLKISKTFAPADFEVEPRFEMLAEWRDVNYAAYTRIQDLATTKLFQLMEEGGYEFIETPQLKAFADAGTKFLKDQNKMPHNMPDGLTKGSLYTAFLTWHPGLSQGIVDLFGGVKPETIMPLLTSTLGISNEALNAILASANADSTATPEQQLKAMKALVMRFINHASFIKVVQDAEQKQLDKAEKSRLPGKPIQLPTFMSERLMSSTIDAMRISDCKLYMAVKSGESVTPEFLRENEIVKDTVIWHDLIRVPDEVVVMGGGKPCATEPLELTQF